MMKLSMRCARPAGAPLHRTFATRKAPATEDYFPKVGPVPTDAVRWPFSAARVRCGALALGRPR